jgi:uncharacterized protein YneF (UPF0154 family)
MNKLNFGFLQFMALFFFFFLFLSFFLSFKNIPYILESNPHPNLIRTQVLAIS